jgi:nucleoside-diphosphate-sugar epimerase
MVRRLKAESYWVRAVDLKRPQFSESAADEFVEADLRDPAVVDQVIRLSGEDAFHIGINAGSFEEIYQFAADMGGANYIFTGDNDACVMHNSVIINLNVLNSLSKLEKIRNSTKVFYSSSACIYPEQNQLDPDNPECSEATAYPANPDSEYGWEKLFSERLYFAFSRNYGIPVRVARFHNIFGPEGAWTGGKEKAPAAICRKIAESTGEIEVWGDGQQTRSFLYIDECIEAVRRLMESDFMGPVNIGSEEMVTINRLVEITAEVAGKSVVIKHVEGPTGVRGRNSNNALIREKLGWDYAMTLSEGIERTYAWICQKVHEGNAGLRSE